MQQDYLHFVGKERERGGGSLQEKKSPSDTHSSTETQPLVLQSQYFMHTPGLKAESPGFAWAKATSKLMYSRQVHLPPSPPSPSAPSCASSSKNPFGQTLQQLPSASLSVKISQLDCFLLLCNLLSDAYWGRLIAQRSLGVSLFFFYAALLWAGMDQRIEDTEDDQLLALCASCKSKL